MCRVHLHRCWFIFVHKAMCCRPADETDWTTVAMVLNRYSEKKNKKWGSESRYCVCIVSAEAHIVVVGGRGMNLKETVCLLPA